MRRPIHLKRIITTTWVLVLLALPVLANDLTNRLTATDVFNFEFATDPQISPDGSKIIYVRQFSDIMTDKRYSNLWMINFDGTNHRALTTGNYHDSSPRWSSDGSRIIFVSDREGTPQIYLRWMDTGQTYKLTNLEYAPSGIAWSPDGSQISFTTHVPEPPRMITDLPAPPAEAKWAEKPMVIDKLVYRWNRVGYIKPGYTHLFVLPSEGGTPRQISTGNYYHGGFGFFTSEAVWTPDGKYLIMSVNRREDYEYEPRDTEIYEFSIKDRFDVEKQIWAANDFVVLYTNPRGSTSYGEEFGNLIHHAYPGDEFYDLKSGVDAVIAKGYIDTDNLFVTGGSGGGVLTCWMIGRTDRFRAAASAYPVINWYSFTLTADISAFVSKYWFPGLPWEQTEQYMKRSLLSVVKNVKTPTMVITGENDYRTPMSESEQYYQALKLLKIESVLVRVPNEPHGIRKRPSHHMAKIMYIMSWFNQHMKKT